jgi:hypothetical protein
MKGIYKRYGCKMGCGWFKCKNDTPHDPKARKRMKHINKVRDRREAAKEMEINMKK